MLVENIEDLLQILLCVFLSYLVENCAHLTVLTEFTAYIGLNEDLKKYRLLRHSLSDNLKARDASKQARKLQDAQAVKLTS